ncbi:hypothetical protein Tco_0003956 [Tanacetum coccineum]
MIDLVRRLQRGYMMKNKLSGTGQRAELNRRRQQEVIASAMYYTKADWINIMAQVKSNASLSKTLLGDDVTEDNFPVRMAALIKRKKQVLLRNWQRGKEGKGNMTHDTTKNLHGTNLGMSEFRKKPSSKQQKSTEAPIPSVPDVPQPPVVSSPKSSGTRRKSLGRNRLTKPKSILKELDLDADDKTFIKVVKMSDSTGEAPVLWSMLLLVGGRDLTPLGEIMLLQWISLPNILHLRRSFIWNGWIDWGSIEVIKVGGCYTLSNVHVWKLFLERGCTVFSMYLISPQVKLHGKGSLITKLHLLRVEMVINSPWTKCPYLRTKGLDSPDNNRYRFPEGFFKVDDFLMFKFNKTTKTANYMVLEGVLINNKDAAFSRDILLICAEFSSIQVKTQADWMLLQSSYFNPQGSRLKIYLRNCKLT